MEESFVIQSSKSKILKEKIDKINRLFDVKVEIQLDPNVDDDDGSQWIHIKSNQKDKQNATDAKTHIIALCNPECSERASFPGFPVFIFTAFKERCKYRIEKDCGVVLSVTDDASLYIHGTNIGVTLAISQIHHLRKLQRDLDSNKDREAAMQFDLYVEEIADDCQQELQTLSNPLKKELLNLLDIPLNDLSSLGATSPKVVATSSNILSEPKPKLPEPEIITIPDDTIIEVSSESAEDESGSDDDEDIPSTSSFISSDGGVNKGNYMYLLPPTFAIKEWIKIHYQSTGDPRDFVNKSEMLDHFKTHFDLLDHPELANTFFDMLARRIFPQDPNYRSVQTKKTKCKRSRRRLVCLKRRILSEKEEYGILPLPKPVNAEPATKIAKSNPPPNPTSNLMKHWNSNRAGLKPINVPPNQPQPNHTTVPLQAWQPPRQPQSISNSPNRSQNLQTWLNSAPAQRPRTQPKYDQKRANVSNSLASRVSKMSNSELIDRPRPPVNPNLRPIVIDGSNVAMSHGNARNFSCRGIAICARYFMERGHGEITCFVPNYRKGGGGTPPSSDAHLLIKLEDKGIVKSTPSRRIRGQNVVCYDDRFIVELAGANNGVILSNDQYRDLMSQDEDFRPVVEQQLLQYTIVGDLLMLPEDPLGRNGPSLDEFLSFGRNGLNTQKQKIVKVPSPARPRQNVMQPPALLPTPQPSPLQQMLVAPRIPVTGTGWVSPMPQPQTLSQDQHMMCVKMQQIFPNRENDIRKVVADHPLITDIQVLMEYLLISDQGV